MVDDFDQKWNNVVWEICKAIASDNRINLFRQKLNEKGFLELSEKSEFIEIADSIKYQIIHQHFGEDNTPEYDAFKHEWQAWFTEKAKFRDAVESPSQQIVDHLLFGSTPDPEEFLKNFHP